MRKKPLTMRWSLLVAAAFLSACAGTQALPALPTRPAAVSAEALIAVSAPAAAPGLYQLLQSPTQVTPNDASTLARIEVWLKRDAGGATHLGDLTGDKRSVKLNQLRLDAAYHVQLKGFKANPNLASDPGFTMQISEDNASSASFRTDPDASGAYALDRSFTVPLKLSNQVFAGTATGGITLTEGTLSSTVEAEALATGAL